jgi:hypothetical protein
MVFSYIHLIHLVIRNFNATIATAAGAYGAMYATSTDEHW